MSRYELVIKNETNGTSSQSPIAGQSGTAQTSKQGGENRAAKVAVKALVSFKGIVKPFVQPMIDQHIQTIQLRTGSSEAQQNIQFAYNLAEQAVGLVSTVAIGAVVGNLPGAILAAGMGIMSSVINYANRAEKINMERSLEDITLRGMNVRAGGYAPSYAGSRSGRQ